MQRITRKNTDKSNRYGGYSTGDYSDSQDTSWRGRGDFANATQQNNFADYGNNIYNVDVEDIPLERQSYSPQAAAYNRHTLQPNLTFGTVRSNSNPLDYGAHVAYQDSGNTAAAHLAATAPAVSSAVAPAAPEVQTMGRGFQSFTYVQSPHNHNVDAYAQTALASAPQPAYAPPVLPVPVQPQLQTATSTQKEFSYSKATALTTVAPAPLTTEAVLQEATITKGRYQAHPKQGIMLDITKRTEKQPVAKPATNETPAKKQLSSKDKKMLLIYLTIVVAVVVAIIATGIAISQANTAQAALSATAQEQQQMLILQEAELARLQDPEFLRLLALGQNMQPIDTYTSIELIELNTPPTHTAPTNWFDRLSRFISGLF